MIALAVYAAKILLFALSTGVSHAMSYSILEGLRLRPATVQNADQLLVVADVQLAEHGTHAELLRQNGLYRRSTEICEQAEGWRIDAE